MRHDEDTGIPGVPFVPPWIFGSDPAKSWRPRTSRRIRPATFRCLYVFWLYHIFWCVESLMSAGRMAFGVLQNIKHGGFGGCELVGHGVSFHGNNRNIRLEILLR